MNYITKTIDVEIEATAADLGAIFAMMPSEEQAEFFNAVAKTVKEKYTGTFDTQCRWIADADKLTSEGRDVMQTLGEYATPEAS